MKYLQFKIAISNDYREALINELEEMGFDEYQQMDEELIVYIPQKKYPNRRQTTN